MCTKDGWSFEWLIYDFPNLVEKQTPVLNYTEFFSLVMQPKKTIKKTSATANYVTSLCFDQLLWPSSGGPIQIV